MIIGGLIGLYVSINLFPVGMFDTGLAYIQLPLLGEVNRLVVFLTGMLAVIGGGFTAFLS